MQNMPSDVFVADFSADGKPGMAEKLGLLMKAIGLGEIDLQRRLVAVKMHFGESGNTAYVRPVYAARVIAFLNERGARPFLTDTNTLYTGTRHDSVSHYLTAIRNGFDPASIGAPVIISGGLRGTAGKMVPVPGSHFREVEIAGEILDADVLVGITHFKGHEMSGFGGTIKNFGMGAATRRGKLAMHSRVSPLVAAETCTGCRLCLRWCAQGALAVEGGKARVREGMCVGCGACLPICPAGAIRIVWNEQTRDMQEKMAEYACGALKGHLPDRAFFLNFITQVSPLCDCYPFTGAPIVPDAGILASRDPVALDQACVDRVNAQRGLEGSALPLEAIPPGADKFRAIHPGVDWEIQLVHAERLAMGRRSYRLMSV